MTRSIGVQRNRTREHCRHVNRKFATMRIATEQIKALRYKLRNRSNSCVGHRRKFGEWRGGQVFTRDTIWYASIIERSIDRKLDSSGLRTYGDEYCGNIYETTGDGVIMIFTAGNLCGRWSLNHRSRSCAGNDASWTTKRVGRITNSGLEE